MVSLIAIADQLCKEVARPRLGRRITHVYNPLEYARGPHHEYLRRYGKPVKEVVLVGMNPGPWGMVQTGVPFGEVSMVRDWLGIKARVKPPAEQHPKRPILGFDCRRSEVSGRRIWGWAGDTFGTPRRFFARFFIANYCPLAFFDAAGRNITPDRLPLREARELFEACDRALRGTVGFLKPQFVIGVGRFSESRIESACEGLEVRTGRILHPSPASPEANRGWARRVAAQLRACGVEMPSGRLDG